MTDSQLPAPGSNGKSPEKAGKDDIKDAVLVGTGEAPAKLPPQQLTMTQQFFVWVLILVVGVLFGMGGSMSLFGQQSRILVGNVSESEALQRKNIAERLDQAFPGNYPPFAIDARRYGDSVMNYYANNIRMARLAEKDGLRPAGRELERIVQDFLDEPAQGGPRGQTASGRTRGQVLLDLVGGKKEVTRDELALFLAERSAVTGLESRNVTVAAIAPAMDVLQIPRPDFGGAESIDLEVVELSAKDLIPVVKDDDAELDPTYRKLAQSTDPAVQKLFRRPAAVTVSVAHADVAKLRESITVTDVELQAQYEKNKERYKIPEPSKLPGTTITPDPKKETAYRPFAEVKDELKKDLVDERVLAKARALADEFDAVVTDKVLHEAKDNQAFIAAAKEKGLVVDALVIDEPGKDGQLDFHTLGTVADQAGLFNTVNQPGLISRPLVTNGASRNAIVVRLDARKPAATRELTEVKDQVKQRLAAKRSYKDLIAKAKAIREAAEKAGTGGLAAWAASDEGKKWNAKVTLRSAQTAADPINPPADELDGTPGESRMVGSMSLPDRPVALEAGRFGELEPPKVSLVQVKNVTPAPTPMLTAEAQRKRAEAFQYFLGRYRQQVFSSAKGEGL